jgi:dihydrofolate reductase
MGKLVVNTFLSVDGVMQAPGGPDEDRDGGFEYGGWGVTQWDDDMGQRSLDVHVGADALLLGRKTYEIFAAHWPRVDEHHEHSEMAVKLNSMPKYVASRTLDRLDWNNSTLLAGDTAAAVEKLKADIPEILVAGSCDLLQTLIARDLVDEFVLWTFPVVLGTGKRLFGQGAVPAGLKLVDSTTSSTGVAIHTYERTGPPAIGSFALDDEG